MLFYLFFLEFGEEVKVDKILFYRLGKLGLCEE